MTAPHRIYLDYNATAPLRPCALEAMSAAAKLPLGNPSSPHQEGRTAHALLDEARGRVAALMGVKHERVVFTSGGTEAVNAMMLGSALAGRVAEGRRIAITATDHACVRETAARLEQQGYVVDTIPVDDMGRVQQDVLTETVSRRPEFVVTHWANNETGVVQDVEVVGALCAEHDVPLLLDAVQALGK